DPDFMAAKREAEAELRARVAADPSLVQRIGDPWSDLEAVQETARDLYLPYRQLEQSAGGGSTLYAMARAIVRSAGADEARRARLAEMVGEETPITPEMEELRLRYWLSKTREYLTVDHPQVKALLGRESPEALAERLIE